jgi:hypothetical protein
MASKAQENYVSDAPEPQTIFPAWLFLLLQYLLQSCSRGGTTMEDMCYEGLRAEACVD